MIPEPDLALAERLFGALRDASFDGVGITRDTYGEGEQRAHDMVEEVARERGFEIAKDAALNMYLTLPGADRSRPAVMTGSHLDSVPRGGNFDGAAGVLAGLSVLVGWRDAGFTPAADTTLMVIRAEESSWFPVSYLGSRAALGLLPPSALDTPRNDNGRPWRDHLAELGGSPERVAAGEAWLDPARIAAFVEVHIEQGPVLVEAGEPVAAVTGIRGSFRYRRARTVGAYAHSGATPRGHRRDAVLATARLVAALSDDWARLEGEGRDLAVTVGRFSTDPEEADFAKVAGRVDFSLDVRSYEPATLDLVHELLAGHAARIEAETGARFELGERTGSTPAPMDEGLRAAILAEGEAMQLRIREMPCGAGHDAATFAGAGVPTAMIFVRNANGSHNPDEAMDFADFSIATRLLGRVLARDPLGRARG